MSKPLPTDDLLRRIRCGSDGLEALVCCPAAEREAILRQLTQEQAKRLLWTWEFWARPEQLWRPSEKRDDWYLCGRGWGKTRVGEEGLMWLAEHPEVCGDEFIIAGITAGQRNRDMLYGSSGLLTCAPPWRHLEHHKSDGEIVWCKASTTVGRHRGGSDTYARARLCSGEKPAGFRGQGVGAAWTDEFPFWKHPRECWEALEYTLRDGKIDFPHTINTCTPLPTADLLETVFECDDGRPRTDPDAEYGFQLRPNVRLTRGSSYANRANLAEGYYTDTIARHEGTDLGEQEIHAALLLDVKGALWQYAWIVREEEAPKLDLIAISIDPSGSANSTSAETAIVGGGRAATGRLYWLRDRSGSYTPQEWGEAAIELYDELQADFIIVERSYGGDMVRSTITITAQLPHVVARRRAAGVEREIVLRDYTPKVAKAERAGSVRGLWQQGRVIHVGDPREWVALEHQLTHVDPRAPRKGQRLDRLDATTQLALALTEAKGAAKWSGMRAGSEDRWRKAMLGR